MFIRPILLPWGVDRRTQKRKEEGKKRGGGVIGRKKQTSEIKGVKSRKTAGELRSQESRQTDDDERE